MRILGLDVGVKSIKAVEIDSSFGRFDIHEYHERLLNVGDNPNIVVSQLVGSLARTPDRIAVSMPTHRVTFRNLQLPSKDKKAIQATVSFELEDELPFALENAVYDFSVLASQKQGARVHVSASLQSHVIEELEVWRARGLDPDLLTTEAWAYRTFFMKALPNLGPEAANHPIFIINMGHEKTIIYGQWQGSPILTREIAWGGKDLTQAIGQKYSLPLESAEKAKIDRGFIAPPSQFDQLTPDQAELSLTLSECLSSFQSELRQSELACKTVSKERPAVLYLIGGSSLLPGLKGWLEETNNIPVKNLPALSSMGSSGVTYSEPVDATFLPATALALCQVGAERAAAINFRKEKFSKRGQIREFNVGRFKEAGMAAAVVLFFFLVSQIVQSSVYERQIKDVNSQLEKSVRAFFGGQLATGAIHSRLSSPATLRTQINEELTKQRQLSKLFQPNPHSPTDFLRELSAAVPKDIVVDMVQYQVGAEPSLSYFKSEDATTQLTFLLADPTQADRLSNVLSPRLTGITASKIEDVKSPDGPKSKVIFTGKPTESAYGK